MNSAWDIVISELLELDRLRSASETGAATGVNTGNPIENINVLRKSISDAKSAFELKLKEAENDHQRLWELLDGKNAETVILDQRLAQAEGEQGRLRGMLDNQTEEIASLKESNQGLEQKLSESDSEQQCLRSLLDQKDTEADALAKTLSEIEQINQTLETTNREAAQENDLLLLQLHQVQEELKTALIQKQQTEKVEKEQSTQLQQLQINIGQLTETREEQAKFAAGLQKQLEQIEQSFEQKLKNSKNEQVRLRGLLDGKAAETSALQQAKQGMEQINQTLETTNREAAQENELLLQQLHQVQEELEVIFLQKQQLQQAQKEQSTQRQQLLSQVEKLTRTRDDLSLGLDNRSKEIASLTQMLEDAESGKVALQASLDMKTVETGKLAEGLEEANLRLEHQQDIINRNDIRISELNKNLELLRSGLSKQIMSIRQALTAEGIKPKGLHLRSGGALVSVRRLFAMAAAIAANDKTMRKGSLRIYKKSFYRLFKYGVPGAVARLENSYLKIRPDLEDNSTPGIREKLTLQTLEEMQELLNNKNE